MLRANVVLFLALLTTTSALGAQDAAFPGGGDAAEWETLASSVTILRDTWGVPHIYGPTDASVLFGAAYARAEDRLQEDEAHYLSAIGRGPELLGDSAMSDAIRLRTLRREEVARREYAEAPEEVRALAEAYAAGYNYFIWKHPDEAGWKVLTHLEPWHILASYRFDPGLELASPSERRPFANPSSGNRRGSNAWAVGPSRTATGNAMLMANPHTAMDVPHEFHVVSEEGLVTSGIVGYGNSGLPVIGRNRDLGWTLTVNLVDVVDVFRLEVDDPESPRTYRHGERTRELEIWVDTVRVATDSGVEARPVTLRRSHHGPVRRGSDGDWYAVAMSNQDGPGAFEQFYRMARARDLDAFRAALSMRRLTYHNVIYADDAGNIFYTYNGAVPRRQEGIDHQAVLDGSDPDADWGDLLELDQLPWLLNPESGWLQNANSSPFWATAEPRDPDPSDRQAALVGESEWYAETVPRIDLDGRNLLMDQAGNGLRARRSRQLLSAADDVTLDELAGMAMDRRYLAADELLPPLFREWIRYREEGPSAAEGLRGAIKLLKLWDRRGSAGSVATTVFTIWVRQMGAPPPEPEWPLVSRLDAALDFLRSSNGTWRLAWGDLMRHQKPDDRAGETFADDRPSLPLAGANANLTGSIYMTSGIRPEGQERFYAHFGNTYVAVMEFTPEGPRAYTIVPYGQSEDPDSPHYFDQAPLFAQGEFKPSWFTLEQVRENLEEAYHPGERGAPPHQSSPSESTGMR